MGFFSDLFGEPTSGQETALGQTQSLGNTFSSAFQQYLGAQSATFQNLSNIWTPIAEAGPTQQGFGAQELAAMNTQAQQGVGQNYNKAEQNLNLAESTRGGGNQVLPTGAASAQQAGLAAAAANQSSNASLAITNANYAQGRQNWQQATSGLNALGQEYNPSNFGSLASSANAQNFSEQSALEKQRQQAAEGIVNTVGGLAMDAATGGLSGLGNMDFSGGSSIGENIGNFVTGAAGNPQQGWGGGGGPAALNPNMTSGGFNMGGS